MSDTPSGSFSTRKRNLNAGDELSWGETDTKNTEPWSDAIEASSGITVGDTGTVKSGSTIPESGVARWTFDNEDTSGSSAIDVWGDNDATIEGATTGSSGANKTYTTNESYSFDGSSDYVNAGNVLDSTGPFSVSVWVKFDDLTSNQRVVNTNDNSNGFRIIYLAGPDEIDITLEDSGSSDSIRITPPQTDTWVHYCATFDGSTLEIYENATSTGTRSSTGSGSDPEPLQVGDGQFVDAPLDGSVDDLRIYDKGLDGSEVSDLYNNGEI